MERGRVGGLEEMKKGKRREKRQREERRVEECVAVTTIILYHMKACTVLSSVAMVTRSFHFSGSRDFVGVNYFTAISLFNSSNTQTSQSCPYVTTGFACVHVCTITMLPVTVSCR